jgi:hypothetical protein
MLTDDLQLDTTFYVPLNAGISEAITAIKLSDTGSKLNRTLFIGTEYGKVYRVDGLPNNPVTTRIDNNQINNGYISSIDLGFGDSDILVTLSNFGISSVYLTRNGGGMWFPMDRDLPDMPVRWGLFNPFDDYKLLIATEMGVWGLENTSDSNEGWQAYNGTMPSIRVDMIKVRASDSTILAGTHGAGLWWGKIDQGEVTPLAISPEIEKQHTFYPNPFISQVKINDPRVERIKIYRVSGQFLRYEDVNDGVVDLHFLAPGSYVFLPELNDQTTLAAERLIKR